MSMRKESIKKKKGKKIVQNVDLSSTGEPHTVIVILLAPIVKYIALCSSRLVRILDLAGRALIQFRSSRSIELRDGVEFNSRISSR